MDIVEWLRQFKLSTSDSNYNALIVNAKTEEAAEEIEHLRKLIRYKDANGAIDIVETNYISRLHQASQEIERLRQQNAELRENNKLLYNLFHEAVALPQGACPRPATAGDGMFNPQHRALNKATGGE